jgi:hypothetical protein
MNPGDRVKISELKAGDVFEYEEMGIGKRYPLLITGHRTKHPIIYAMNLDNFTLSAFDPNSKYTYLGYLTAEMVREILKTELPAPD